MECLTKHKRFGCYAKTLYDQLSTYGTGVVLPTDLKPPKQKKQTIEEEEPQQQQQRQQQQQQQQQQQYGPPLEPGEECCIHPGLYHKDEKCRDLKGLVSAGGRTVKKHPDVRRLVGAR